MAPIPWTVPLDAMDVRDLPGFLHSACLIITAAVTGMRSSELKELCPGCRRTTTSAAGLTRYRLAGKPEPARRSEGNRHTGTKRRQCAGSSAC